jgi:Protein of unknown function (DUF1579)
LPIKEAKMQLRKTMRVLTWVGILFVIAGYVPFSTAQEQGPPMPKPGPEHELLKSDVGTWDAKVEVTPPDMPPMVSKGVETNTLGCGGLCLISDFKGELAPGQPFHGHGITTWDPVKKKYVGSWTDSMSAGIASGESTWDASAKKMTGTMDMPQPSGGTVKSRMVSEYPTPTTRTMTNYMTGPDGKEFVGLRITYTKK